MTIANPPGRASSLNHLTCVLLREGLLDKRRGELEYFAYKARKNFPHFQTLRVQVNNKREMNPFLQVKVISLTEEKKRCRWNVIKKEKR